MANQSWNTDLDEQYVADLFHAFEFLNSQSNVFDVYRNKIKGIQSLLFKDELDTFLDGINGIEQEYKKFLTSIYDNNEFIELVSGRRRKILKTLDLADGIREMNKRLSDFQDTYDNLIQYLVSGEANKKRDDKCKRYSYQECATRKPCQVKKGFFVNSCRYQYR